MIIMIEIKGLTKMYDNLHGINGIDLKIETGVSLGLLGRNGAGKTTLVRTLIGLLRADSGEATINGISAISDPDSVRKTIGYLPEVFGLYNEMTVYNILDYTARLHQMDKSDITDRIAYLLDRLELSDIKGMKTGSLSKGLRQKVGFARALVNDPQVVFLDEPTSGLDPIAARGIESLVMELKKDGKTLLITSHILPETEKMCDSVAIIKGGQLVTSGSLAEVKRKYAEPSVIVRLQDAGNATKAVELLRPMFKECISASDSTITISSGETDSAMALINKRLVGADLAVIEIRREESSLDDVYFKAMEA
jgi:ABC-2 type transport system ATP-binding protein